MKNQKIYAHGWYSQPGQSRSTREERPNYSYSTALASYLPKEPSSSPKILLREDVDIHSTPQVWRKWATPPTLLQTEPVELGNDVDHHGLQRKQLYAEVTIPHASSRLPTYQRSQFQSSEHRPVQGSEAQSMHPAPPQELFVETLYSPGPKEAPSSTRVRPESGQTVYPNMLDTHFGRVPRYPAPAWLSQSVPQPPAGRSSYQRPYPMQSSTLEWLPEIGLPSGMPSPATRSGFFLNGDSYIQTTPPPIPPKPWVSSFEQLQDSKLPPPIPPRPSAVLIEDMHAQDVSPLISTQMNVISTETWQASSTLPPFAQHSKTAPMGAAFSRDTTIDVPPEQYQSSRESTQPFLSHIQSHDDIAVPSHDKIQFEQPFTSAHLGLVEVTEQLAEAEGFTQGKILGEYPTEKATDYDNFYTPANESFYTAKPYTKLNQKLKEFRLLRIFPKRPSWQHYETRPDWDASHARSLGRNLCFIACEIEKTSLTRIGDNYTTLSYCAGDPQNTAVILVDGIPFNAFANLEHAIDRLLAHWSSIHPGEESLLLWADQISINQSDKDERSEQVQIMRDIYRRSAEMYVCMSVPKIEDCLSWVPRMPAQFKLPNAVSRKEDPYGVLKLKDLLLDSLVGKEKGGALRSVVPKSTATTETITNDEGPTNQNLYPLKGVALQQQSSTIDSGDFLQNCGSLKGIRPPGRILNPSRYSIAGFNGEEGLQTSAMDFQSSLAAFMTNKWWRR